MNERITPYDPALVEHYLVRLHERRARNTRLSPQDYGLYALGHRLDSLVLYEDNYLMVVNKPAGVVSHYSEQYPVGLLEVIRYMRGWQLGLVHRLDVNTTGAVLFSKYPEIFEDLASLFSNRDKDKLTKVYTAFLHGHLMISGQRTIELPLAVGDKKTEVWKEGDINIGSRRDSVTIFEQTKMLYHGNEPVTHAKIRLDTGRQHQIRVVAAHLGHPVVGDSKYGDGRLASRTLLHAACLSLQHPREPRRTIIAEAPLPVDMELFGEACVPA